MTQTTPTANAPAVKRGFDVRCLSCGEPSVRVYLSDTELFQCGDCDAEFTLKEVRERLAGWAAVLAWVEKAPSL
jgi:hypothetical protein